MQDYCIHIPLYSSSVLLMVSTSSIGHPIRTMLSKPELRKEVVNLLRFGMGIGFLICGTCQAACEKSLVVAPNQILSGRPQYGEWDGQQA